MPGKEWNTEAYRYGMNTQEKDDEIYGKGNTFAALFWEYDARLGRRWNVDPLFYKFPWQTTYSSFDNNPISKIDPTGESAGDFFTKDGKYLGTDHINDNFAYVTSEETVKQNTTTQTNWEEVKKSSSTINLTKKYNITFSQLLDRANWIYAEGGYKIPEHYAYTIENAFKSNNKNEKMLYYYLMYDNHGRLDKDKYLSGGYEHNTLGRIFWKLRSKPESFDIDMQNTIRAVIYSKVFPEKDPTGGTNSWLGYETGYHVGEYYITSLGRRHFFGKFSVSKKTENEVTYKRVE
jgi:hypothetical protein